LKKESKSWLDSSLLHFSEDFLVAAKISSRNSNDNSFSSFKIGKNVQFHFQNRDCSRPLSFINCADMATDFIAKINRQGKNHQRTSGLRNNGSDLVD
jgi:hypothetical protein